MGCGSSKPADAANAVKQNVRFFKGSQALDCQTRFCGIFNPQALLLQVTKATKGADGKTVEVLGKGLNVSSVLFFQLANTLSSILITQ